MFATKNTLIFILLLSLIIVIGAHKAFGQAETGKFDFYLKANAGPLFHQNDQESTFKPEVTACFGSHLIAKYSFSRIGFSTGIGFDRLKFSQRIEFAQNAEEREYSTIDFSYLLFDIPILVNYSITERLEIFGGVNIIAANWVSYGITAVSNRTSELNASADWDSQRWQFTQEVMAGLNYKLTDRFDIGLVVARSLSNLDRTNVDLELSVPGLGNSLISEKFDYSWTRLNLELAYRLNK